MYSPLCSNEEGAIPHNGGRYVYWDEDIPVLLVHQLELLYYGQFLFSLAILQGLTFSQF